MSHSMNESQTQRVPIFYRSRKASRFFCGGLILSLLLGICGTSFAKPSKVNVCHRPPDNPSKQKILRIGASAWPAHQAHGDNLVGPEICDGIDNDCDGFVDEDISDIVTGSDVGVCQPEIQSCIGGGFQVIQAAILPTSEICDGLDNDCDAQVDDGIAALVSGTNVGACQEEIQQCQGGQFVVTQAAIEPASETCNNIDDDCNGEVDNGIADLVSGTNVGACEEEIQQCQGGQFVVTQVGVDPSDETCDAVDNDCNGIVDDEVPVIAEGTDVGACQPELRECQDGHYVLTQSAIEPAAETCNNIDDDCNGEVDNGIADLVSGSNVGACQEEIQQCQGGQFVVTQVAINPTAETCDAIDNNCDGAVDEGLDQVETGTDEGECQKGISECTNGVFVIVQEEIEPSPEICDGLDNDCDGTSDGPTAFSDCEDNVACTNDVCLAATCVNTAIDSQCGEGEICNADLGCTVGEGEPDEGDTGDGGCGSTIACEEDPPVVVPPVVVVPPIRETPIADSPDDGSVVESPDSDRRTADSPDAEGPIAAEPVENTNL